MSHDEERYIRHHILYSNIFKKTTVYSSLKNIKYIMDEIHKNTHTGSSLIKEKIKKLLDLNK